MDFWKIKVDSRSLAYKILYKFENGDDKIPDIRKLVFSNYPKKNELKFRSTVLVNEIIRFKGRLDLMIVHISGKKLSFLNKKVLIILRIGFYEIIFDHKVPDYAAVDSSVNLARKFTNKKTIGFTNAVLRSLVRKKDNNPNWYEGLKYKVGWSSVPVWMEKRWLVNFGEKNLAKLIEFINQPSDTFIRCDTDSNCTEKKIRLLEADGINTELFSNNFLKILSNESKVLSSKLFKNGNISIQSPSAAAIVDCLGIQRGDVVLDVCAAPGTKTLQLANLVGVNGFVYASDLSPDRVSFGQKDEKRHRKKNIKWSLKDARKDAYVIADKILIDAPCSGTGVIGRRTDIRWRRRESDLKKFANMQLSIINNCSKYLKKGGALVYATCSIEPEENLMVVDKFLNLNSNFVVDKIPNNVPRQWVKDNKTLNVFPHKHGLDGIFAIRMKKIF
jgi:16S rRNA (cytosine967-C5)-methyltransferase